MREEEARRLVLEETFEHKKPKDKEEKRFLRIIAHFDELLFKESLLGEPIPEGEKSATIPLKLKLQGEGFFAAVFFHIVSLAAYVFFLLFAFWVKYDPDSSQIDRLVFTSPLYPVLSAALSGTLLAAVPLYFIRKYVIYPGGYLFTRVFNFLIGYWAALLVFALIELFRIVSAHLFGERLLALLLPELYKVIDRYFSVVPYFLFFLSAAFCLAGVALIFMTRKDILNAMGVLLVAFGSILGVLTALLYKYGYTPTNAKWLVYYLSQFVLSSVSEKAGLFSLLIPLSTYLVFRKRVSELERKMYRMPYS